MKKLLVLSIFFILLMIFTATVNATNEFEFGPMFIALKSHMNNLDIEDSVATCTGSARCSDDYSVRITLYLERYVNNKWTPTNIWDGDKGIYSSVNKTAIVSSDYRYRLKSVAVVYDENNKVVESPVLYSDIVSN